MSHFNDLDEIDPVVGKMLELLKTAPERDPDLAKRSRARYITELDALFPAQMAAGNGARHRSTPLPQIIRRRPWTGLWNSRPALAWALATLAVVVVFLATGAITAQAAQNALPGDALYPIKTSLEQARLAVTLDPDKRLELYLTYADRRLQEANSLVEIGRFADAEMLVIEVEAQVKTADAALRVVEQDDPDQGERLRAVMILRLNGFSVLFSNMTTTVPPSLQPSVQSALDSVQAIIDEGTDSGGGRPSPFSHPVERPSEPEKPAANENGGSYEDPETESDRPNDPPPANEGDPLPGDNGNGSSGGETPPDDDDDEDETVPADDNVPPGNTNNNTNDNENTNDNANGSEDNSNANGSDDNANSGDDCSDQDNDGTCDDGSNANNNSAPPEGDSSNTNDPPPDDDSTNANDNSSAEDTGEGGDGSSGG